MLGGAEGGSGVRALRDDPLTKTPSVGTLPFVRVWEVPPSLPRTVPPVQHGAFLLAYCCSAVFFFCRRMLNCRMVEFYARPLLRQEFLANNSPGVAYFCGYLCPSSGCFQKLSDIHNYSYLVSYCCTAFCHQSRSRHYMDYHQFEC